MVDRKAAARAIEDFLRALGHEPEGELEGTGQRVADAWADDLLEGESIDAAAVLRDGAMEWGAESGSSHSARRGGEEHAVGAASPGLVLIRDLSVTTMCPHHLLPAYGTALVAYLPTHL